MNQTPPTAEAIPPAILECPQWVCWRGEERDGKQTKVPLNPKTGRYASTTNDDTWTGFETARARAVEKGEGVGFVFSDDDEFVGVDLDDCRDPDSGMLDDWAREVVECLDSYTEVSPSGTGVHVLLRGSLPPGRNRRGGVELYETSRFFTVSGEHLSETPTTLAYRQPSLAAVYKEHVAEEGDRESESTPATREQAAEVEDDELVRRAMNAANGQKFRQLWRGNTAGYDSQSEADMALCAILAFWTGGDATQVDRLFRQSGLIREKWDDVHFADGSTYGEKTIERAIDGTDEFYEPRSTGLQDSRARAPDRSSAPADTDAHEAPAETEGVTTTILQNQLRSLESEVLRLKRENERLSEALAAEREQSESPPPNTTNNQNRIVSRIRRLFSRKPESDSSHG